MSQKQDDPDKMQVDDVDDIDSDSEELPQYSTEKLAQCNIAETNSSRLLAIEEIRNLDKPNFKILDEFKKRVC